MWLPQRCRNLTALVGVILGSFTETNHLHQRQGFELGSFGRITDIPSVEVRFQALNGPYSRLALRTVFDPERTKANGRLAQHGCYPFAVRKYNVLLSSLKISVANIFWGISGVK